MVRLSVCVPAANAGRTLAATLRSILDQDVEMEVLVLDNASRDETWRITASFDDERVRLERDSRALPRGEHWNKAVSLSTGKLVKLVRADDLLLPAALPEQLRVMGDNGIALATSSFRLLDEHGAIGQRTLAPPLLGPHDTRALLRAIVRGGPASFGPITTAIFRRADFDRVGGFRGDLVRPMGVDLLARLSVFGTYHGMAETTAAWNDPAAAEPATCGAVTEMLRFHHRLRYEYPQLLGCTDLLAGDLRVVRAAVARLRA
ncbi:glycosyltransferase family 2 protein [Nocardia sp. NPDC050406]|uniref:glycosyltransferase family 2 protein n=1 Tax=Nocardia sp. NPDC050406 TaxID=3364318 RepID=UPI0037B7762B